MHRGREFYCMMKLIVDVIILCLIWMPMIADFMDPARSSLDSRSEKTSEQLSPKSERTPRRSFWNPIKFRKSGKLDLIEPPRRSLDSRIDKMSGHFTRKSFRTPDRSFWKPSSNRKSLKHGTPYRQQNSFEIRENKQNQGDETKKNHLKKILLEAESHLQALDESKNVAEKLYKEAKLNLKIADKYGETTEECLLSAKYQNNMFIQRQKQGNSSGDVTMYQEAEELGAATMIMVKKAEDCMKEAECYLDKAFESAIAAEIKVKETKNMRAEAERRLAEVREQVVL